MVYQTRLDDEYAVPTPSLALLVHRGAIPGRPKAGWPLCGLAMALTIPLLSGLAIACERRVSPLSATEADGFSLRN
jgi:hypothetical protein